MHQRLTRVSPLAVPIMLEISKEQVQGEARTDILADAAEALIREAMGEPPLEAAAAPLPKRAAPRAQPRAGTRALRHG
jgi:hypothetical protein